jgi:proteasome lid subunit RPN8/RPN11
VDPLNDHAGAELVLQHNHLEVMRLWVAEHAPEEACGLLGGVDRKVLQVIGVENELHNPWRYRMQPSQQLQAFQTFDEQGWELLGIFHSHPSGPSGLSPTDLAEAYYPQAIQLVWFLDDAEWQFHAFQIAHGLARKVKVEVAATE